MDKIVMEASLLIYIYIYTTEISIYIVYSLKCCGNDRINYFRSSRLEVELSWFTLT